MLPELVFMFLQRILAPPTPAELGASSPELCEGKVYEVCKGQVCETHSDPGLPNNKVLSPSGAVSPVSPFTAVLARPPSSLGPNSDA